uniref:Putative secreted protein n=1 Tax=Anopheles darlingi TaxID=43151 RepID=A0A2M4DPL6_ANODA
MNCMANHGLRLWSGFFFLCWKIVARSPKAHRRLAPLHRVGRGYVYNLGARPVTASYHCHCQPGPGFGGWRMEMD